MGDEGGSSFPARPVAPGGSRRPWVVAGLVVAAIVASFLSARLSPQPEPAPSQAIASIRPTATAPLDDAIATPLPPQEWFSGPDVPRWDDLLVETSQVRWLRLGAPRLTPEPLARPGRDLLLRAEGGGTVCLCWQVPRAAFREPGSLDLVRTDEDRQAVSRTTVLINEEAHAGRVNGPERAALEPSPDGRFVYLARAVRAEAAWRLSLEVIDLRSATIVDRVELLSVAQDSLSDWGIAERPTLRIAPDGRHALVLSSIFASERLGRPPPSRRAWIVDLDGPSIDRVVAADAIAAVEAPTQVGGCPWTAFVTPTMIARGCRPPAGGDAMPDFSISRFDLEGTALDPVIVDGSIPAPVAPLIDATHGVVYGWDPAEHYALAVDLLDPSVRSRSLGDLVVGADPAVIAGDSRRPAPGPAITWTDGRDSTAVAIDRPLAGSPDGQVLFATSDGSRLGSSAGILVFGAPGLRLLERWPPRASYSSVTVFGDGRWLAALGRPGVTATGSPAEWGPSVTIHEANSGVSVLRIGDLDAEPTLAFPWPGPLAVSP